MAGLDLSHVSRVLLADGWHSCDPGTFSLTPALAQDANPFAAADKRMFSFVGDPFPVEPRSMRTAGPRMRITGPASALLAVQLPEEED